MSGRRADSLWLPWTLANLAVAFGYILTSSSVLWLDRLSGLALPPSPAAGLAFVCLLRWGTPVLPGVMAGALVFNLLDLASRGWSMGQWALLSAIPAAGSSLQALVAAWLVARWVGPRPSLSKLRDILLFLGIAGPLSCVIAPALGIPTQVLGGELAWADAWRAALLWWFGDSISVIIFAPLLLLMLPGQDVFWPGRCWVVALPSLVMTGLAVGLFLHAGNLHNRQMDRSIDRAAERAAQFLEMKLAWQEGALQSLGDFFGASKEVTPSTFRTSTRSILEKTDGLVALSWNPLVTREQRPAFENRLQEDYGDLSLRITERRQGLRQPAADYASHVVVAQIEPFEANRAALGYDIQSDPTRAQALHRAVRIRSMQATAPIQLVQGKQSQIGVLKVLPVPCESGSVRTVADSCQDLRGFVVGVFQLDELLASVFAAPLWQDLNLHLSDVTSGAEPLLMARYPTENETKPRVDDTSRRRALMGRRRFGQAGRLWELEVKPRPSYFLNRPPSSALAVLLGGLSIVAMLETLLLLITGIESESRRGLQQKLRLSLVTAALAHEIKQPLTALLFQSRKIDHLVSKNSQLAQRPELEKAIIGLRKSCLSVSDTITNIQLLLSSRQTESAPLDLADVVCHALLIVKSKAADRGIHLQSCGCEQPQMMIGDFAQLQLLVLNLLRNSLEATPSGGVVETAVVRSRFGLTLRVADSGQGFMGDPDDPNRFLLASSKSGGLGLGLFMVRSAAENHGADIRFGHSSLGGAQVEVFFPTKRSLPTVGPGRQLG